MATRQEKFEYLKVKRISFSIGEITSIPVLIWLHYLGYMAVFWIVLAIWVIELVLHTKGVVMLQKELGLDKY